MKNPIKDTIGRFEQGDIDKATFIGTMYQQHHAALFQYADFLKNTNIRKIEIEDDSVIMTSRDLGIRIACPAGDLRVAPIEILNFLDYEIDDSRMIDNLVAEGSNFFDVGANIGWYSIRAAVSRRDVAVHAFEPIPSTFAGLQKNIALNGLTNIKACNFGFSNKQEELTFFFYPEGSSNASAANLTDHADVVRIPCQVRMLDDYAEETGSKVDFIKCDVEGAELFVFEGGRNTIARDQPIVFSEILRKWSRKFDYEPNRIFEFFEALGYQAFTTKGKFLTPFGRMDEETVETNFFFLHAKKHAALIRKYSA